MKKDEMQAHRDEYYAVVVEARSAESEALWVRVVDLAVQALDYVDGMMRFEGKYNDKTFASVEAIDLILRYAPLVFHTAGLDALEQLLKSKKRIERETSDSLQERLAKARLQMVANHELWRQIEGAPEMKQSRVQALLDAREVNWRSTIDLWERADLVRSEHRGSAVVLSIPSRMDESIDALCTSCGFAARGPKSMFLEPTSCARCHCVTDFVFTISPDTSSDAR